MEDDADQQGMEAIAERSPNPDPEASQAWQQEQQMEEQERQRLEQQQQAPQEPEDAAPGQAADPG